MYHINHFSWVKVPNVGMLLLTDLGGTALTNTISIGATVQMIQRAKGLSVKAITDNERIISKSTYYRFVNETSHIPADRFMQLLGRLELTLQEFDFILHHYQLPPVEQLLQQIQRAIGAQDNLQLRQLQARASQLAKVTHAHRYDQLTTLTRLALHHLTTPHQPLDQSLETALNAMIQDLLNLQLWSKYDLMLCSQIFTSLAPAQQTILLTAAHKSFHKYQQLTDESLTFMTFLANQLFSAVHNNQPQLITQIYQMMTTLTLPAKQLVPPLLLKFCRGIVDDLTKQDQSLDACKQALAIVRCLHVQYWDTVFQDVLNDLRSSSN